LGISFSFLNHKLVSKMRADSVSVCLAILETVAEQKDTELPELDFVLDDHIDTDAMRRLASHRSTSWTLSFELPESTVTVTGEGHILVDEDSQTPKRGAPETP